MKRNILFSILLCALLLTSCGSSIYNVEFVGVYRNDGDGVLILDRYEDDLGYGLARYVTRDRSLLTGRYTIHSDNGLYCEIIIDGLAKDVHYMDTEDLKRTPCRGSKNGDGGMTLSYKSDLGIREIDFVKDDDSPLNYIIAR